MDLLSSALEPLEPLYCLHPLLSGLVYRPGAFGSHLDQAIIDQEQIRYQLQGGGAGLGHDLSPFCSIHTFFKTIDVVLSQVLNFDLISFSTYIKPNDIHNVQFKEYIDD